MQRNFECPIIGRGAELPLSLLPTFQDVLKCWLFESSIVSLEYNGKYPSLNGIAQLVCVKVERLYDKVLIPRLSHKRVKDKILKYFQHYSKILKNFNRDKESEKMKKIQIRFFKVIR